MAAAELTLRVQARQPLPIAAELVCAAGELTALVGPSGSGKSTLLRMIAGLAHPDSGSIRCAAHTWFDSARGIRLSPQQRHVGYVPQHYGLFPHLDALGNIGAGLGHLGAKQRAARARDWLARVGLDGLGRHRPAELSGGQQQRVALARALAREPAILLLDEPFSAVDHNTRETLYLELAALKRELAIPAILVTHDLHEALLLADNMTLLDAGRTLQSGAPRALLAQPASERAARLLGVKNIFSASIDRHAADGSCSFLACGALRIACPPCPQLAPGSQVRWMLAAAAVQPAATQAPAASATTRLTLHIDQLFWLGDEVRICGQHPALSAPLWLQLPQQQAAAHALAVGTALDVLLPCAAIHLFPPTSPP